MIDRVVGGKVGPAEKAVRLKDFLEGFTNHGQRGAFTAEQVPGDVGNFGIEELVHPPHVVDPHDLQCGLE